MAKKIAIPEGDPRDFDETRRLLYMALVRTRTKHYNLVGTLVNALKHHHAVDDLSVEEITGHILAVANGSDDQGNGGDGEEVGRAWVQEQIDRITTELGD